MIETESGIIFEPKAKQGVSSKTFTAILTYSFLNHLFGEDSAGKVLHDFLHQKVPPEILLPLLETAGEQLTLASELIKESSKHWDKYKTLQSAPTTTPGAYSEWMSFIRSGFGVEENAVDNNHLLTFCQILDNLNKGILKVHSPIGVVITYDFNLEKDEENKRQEKKLLVAAKQSAAS